MNNLRRIAIEANELFGDDNAIGRPEGGHKNCRLILFLDDSGNVVKATVDQESNLEGVGGNDEIE